PAARRLAERAAAATGLSLEEWLARAIRGACLSASSGTSATMPSTPVAAPIESPPAPADEPRSALHRAPTIAERLAQQRLDQAEDEEADPSFAQVIPDEHEAEPEAKEAPEASPDEYDFDKLRAKLQAAAANAQLPPSHKGAMQRAVTAVAVAVAVTAGAVTAQYLFPGHPRAPAAPSNSITNSTPSSATPMPNNSPA